jgi:hypothetical protein
MAGIASERWAVERVASAAPRDRTAATGRTAAETDNIRR